MAVLIEREVNTLKETEKFATELSAFFNKGELVILNGELGAGKTTLVQLISRNYGISNAISPTFTIVNEYNGKKKIYHFDFYRLKHRDELYDIGFDDYVNDHEAIIFIEWGYLIREIIPSEHYEILINQVEGEKRKITLKKHG